MPAHVNPHRAKKHFGQNFLTDPRSRAKIIDACGLTTHETVIEIGPGQGAITRLIAPLVGRLIVVEKDRDLIAPLTTEFTGQPVTIVQGDFLAWDMGQIQGPVKVVGNIPYNISTPIIEKLIAHKQMIGMAFLTVQAEFGERLAALPGGKTYGALSCFAQYHADVKVLFKIKNTCFRPVPKVDSCCVCLNFQRPKLYNPQDESKLFAVIRTAFSQRRKTLMNALSPLVPKDVLADILAKVHVPASARPEELNLHNFVAISDQLV